MKNSKKILAWPGKKNRKENPYNFLIYDHFKQYDVEEFNGKRFRIGDADILHAHWPDCILRDKRRWRLKWRANKLLTAIRKLQKRGGKFVWTVHNLKPHSTFHPELSQKYFENFLQAADAFIFLSGRSRELLLEKYPQLNTTAFAVIPHVHYAGMYPATQAIPAREKFNIEPNETVIGIFGRVRDYKGAEAFTNTLLQHPEFAIRVLIAGNPGAHPLSEELKTFLSKATNTIQLLRYIDDDEIPDIFAACDAFIFPYVDILNSGSAILSLSLGRPVIVPNMGSLPELQDKVGKNWVYVYDEPLDEQKLINALAWVKDSAQREEFPDLDFMHPEQVASATEEFFNKILSDQRCP